MRNGIAIAGMAGGMWFLGHAVANADTGQTASADNTAASTSTSDGGSSSNDSTNVAKAENNNSTTVDTGNIKGGNGGTNTATINTGVSSGGSGPSSGAVPATSTSSSGGSSGGSGTSVTASSGNVSVTQQANGGSVSGSGNVKVDNSATQSASASNNVSQNSSSSGSNGHKGDSHDGVSSDSSTFDEGHGHGGGNDSLNVAVARNDNSTEVDTGNIRGGNGGENFADVNTGLLLEPVYEPVMTYDSNYDHGRHDDGNIDVMVATGAVWVRQEANGGDVSKSGNVDVTGSAHQSASASNDVTQTSTSADRRRHHHDGDFWWFGDKGGNDSANIAVAANDNSTYVETGNIRGGGGGLNGVEANTGVIIGFFPYIGSDSTLSTFGMKDDGEYDHHHHGSNIDVTVSTGDISATQEANGGDVSGSGNVSVCTSADQSASASNDVMQNSSSEGKGRSGNDAFNKAIAHNDNSVEVYTGNIRGGYGGENMADLNTGAIIEPYFLVESLSPMDDGEYDHHHHHRSIDVTVSTGDVSATQEANGGDVSGSGNVSANNSAMQTASANNDVTQNSSSKSDDCNWFGSKSGNHSTNIAVSRNDNDTYVETGNIKGGSGGGNEADVNTGLIGPAFFGHLPNSLTVSTGDVQVNQEANGGDVTKSGNVSVGNKEQCGCEQAATPTTPTTPSTPTTPVVKTVVTTTTSVLSATQPTSTLAVTGADTSAPLTAGLLALGAGTALTLAGRRRREGQNG